MADMEIIGFGDSFKIEDIGTLYVTNSCIIFNGENKNNIINFNKIMTTDYFYDSFEMAVENRKSIIALGNLNCEYVCKIAFLIEGQQEKIETAKEMIAYKIDIDTISKHTGLSVDSIEKIKKSMEL